MPIPAGGVNDSSRRSRAARRQVISALLICAALIAAGALALHVVSLIEFGLVIGPIIGDSGIIEASAKNGRGDEAKAVTDANGPLTGPSPTEIRLRLAHHWFWALLLETETHGIGVDLEWRDDDVLDVNLDLGCVTAMTSPVERVGQIQIFYHFTYDHTELGSCPPGVRPIGAAARSRK